MAVVGRLPALESVHRQIGGQRVDESARIVGGRLDVATDDVARAHQPHAALRERLAELGERPERNRVEARPLVGSVIAFGLVVLARLVNIADVTHGCLPSVRASAYATLSDPPARARPRPGARGDARRGA